jgi:SAM-dependent methyltransferase
MTEFELLVDFHQEAKRQGPGSEATTRKALEFIPLPAGRTVAIADIGCGTGNAALTLAAHTDSHITAVDLFPAFLAKLDEEAAERGYADRITTVARSMDDLGFAEAAFDVIWSEGAIYNMGFAAGVKAWRKYLKPGGYLAVSEISWLTATRPAAIERYWNEAYPEIDTISGKIRTLEQSGYTPVAHFILPESCWLDEYYGPIERRFDSFLARHANSEMAQELVANEREEIATYQKFKAYYSYGFYIARKVPALG